MNPQTQSPQSPNLLKDNVEDERWDLLWGVRRSIRYHDRRRRFFDVCHRVVVGTGVVLAMIGFTVANEALDEKWLTVFSILSMFAFLLDLFLGFSNCAQLHTNLKQKFGELEADIIKNKQDDMAPFRAQRLQIEMDEPPILRALDILCHNELARSIEETKEDIYKVGFLQRMTSQLYSWPNIQVELEQETQPLS